MKNDPLFFIGLGLVWGNLWACLRRPCEAQKGPFHFSEIAVPYSPNFDGFVKSPSAALGFNFVVAAHP